MANKSPYILFGMLLSEGLLDIKILTFFHHIINDPDSVLHQVTMRQLATKTLDSNSWFVSIVKLAYKYQLPSPHLVFQYKLKKLRWKKIVKQKVREYWQAKLMQSTKEKPTLVLLQSPANPPSWKHVDHNTHAVSEAGLQACFLTNTYTLQSHSVTYYKEDPHASCVKKRLKQSFTCFQDALRFPTNDP